MFGGHDRELVVLAARNERVTLKQVEAGGTPVVRKVSRVADGFASEVAARETLTRLDLPVASPLSYELGAPSVLTLPWITGSAIGPSTPPPLLEEVGALLAAVHAQPGGPPYAGNSTWSRWMQGWLSHAIEWWDRGFPAERGRMSALEQRLDGLAESMDGAANRLILFDGRPEHFLIARSGLQLIDTEELRAGDPAMDFAVMSIWSPAIVPVVSAGYRRAGGAIDGTFEERVRFYSVLRALAAAEWHSSIVDEPATSVRFVNFARPP